VVLHAFKFIERVFGVLLMQIAVVASVPRALAVAAEARTRVFSFLIRRQNIYIISAAFCGALASSMHCTQGPPGTGKVSSVLIFVIE
jgi:hypothetical protein